MPEDRVVRWLLEEDQPAVRFRTLTELLGRDRSDPEVREAKARIPKVGWAADLLARRRPWGGWEAEGNLYTPKYHAMTWNMLVLADLGMDRGVPGFRRSIDLWADRSTGPTRVLGANSGGKSHYCLAGNMTRALLRFGYVDDPRVAATFEWLVATASPLGGWSCFGSGRNLDSWEGLAAFAEYPRDRWTPGMRKCVDAAVEFYLQRELHRQGEPYEPWFRFHYPVHYYYDLLVGRTVGGTWTRYNRTSKGRWPSGSRSTPNNGRPPSPWRRRATRAR
ncbi:MAG: hypothetical protein L3K08_01005 [Thermoplasmata archaeon]|nr:hypothetical protein [Thermoplasmata archaeon]